MARSSKDIKHYTKFARELILLETYEEYEQEELIEVLQAADNLYYNDQESFLQDSEYDALRRVAEQMNPAHPYFTGVGSEVRGGKIKLPHKMGSLTQVYEGEVTKWIATHGLEKERIAVSDKLDGVSALVLYDHTGNLQIAYSRGDGFEGADITRHVRRLPSLPLSVRNKNLVVRGEIIIAKNKFPLAQEVAKSRSGKPYKNPRNMVAGLMNAEKNPEAVYTYVDFVAYEIIKNGDSGDKAAMLDELVIKHGFLVPGWTTFLGEEINDAALTKHLNDRRQKSVYEIDGVVLDISSDVLREQIEPTKETLNPEYARKFKIADASNLAIATVKNVEWNVSKHGYMKPRVVIEPVTLVGVTVQHATGFNAAFIKNNKIGPGAKIRLTRSGDVIPFILGVVEPAPETQMPTEDCVWTTNDKGENVDLVLTNAADNSTVLFEQINDFFASVDVPALREGNIQKFVDEGFDTIEKIIMMSEHQMVSIVGVNGSKIYKGLRTKLTNIPMYILMGSHSLFGRGIGIRKMKKLYHAFKGDMEKLLDEQSIISVDGFDTKTAKKIIKGYPIFLTFLSAIKEYVTIAPYEEKVQGAMSGQFVVFTGFRDKILHADVEAAGGTMQSAVSGKTTILVAADPHSDSTKMKKAREAGIKIIGPEELRNMLD